MNNWKSELGIRTQSMGKHIILYCSNLPRALSKKWQIKCKLSSWEWVPHITLHSGNSSQPWAWIQYVYPKLPLVKLNLFSLPLQALTRSKPQRELPHCTNLAPSIISPLSQEITSDHFWEFSSWRQPFFSKIPEVGCTCQNQLSTFQRAKQFFQN